MESICEKVKKSGGTGAAARNTAVSDLANRLLNWKHQSKRISLKHILNRFLTKSEPKRLKMTKSAKKIKKKIFLNKNT